MQYARKEEVFLALSTKEKHLCVQYFHMNDFHMEKKNCSVQLCGSRYFLAECYRPSSVKASTEEQSQCYCGSRMHDELPQIICITVLVSDSSCILWQTECLHNARYTLWPEWCLAYNWQKYPSYSFFLITHGLWSLKLTREK